MMNDINSTSQLKFQIPSDLTPSGPNPAPAGTESISSGILWPNELPAIVDALNLSNDQTPLPPVLIDGMLHQGSKMVLGGGSKSYKTWALLDLAFSVGHGVPWLGRACARGPVLFLNFEIQEVFMRERLTAVAEAKGIQIESGALQFWNLRGHATGHAEILPKIGDHIAGKGFALVVLDPLYKLLGAADENSATDMADLFNGIERFAIEAGSAVVFGSHFSKGSQAKKDSMDRISGSGVFARDPDSILTLTAHEEDGAFTVEPTLRNLPPVAPFVVQWGHPLFQPSFLDPKKLKGASNKGVYSVEQLLDCLEDGMTTGEWQKAANEETGIGRGTFYKYIKTIPNTLAEKANKNWNKNSTGPFSPVSVNGPQD